MILGELLLSRFSHGLCQLEQEMNSHDKISSPILPGDVQKNGIQTLKTAKKCALIRTESLKLMGVYYEGNDPGLFVTIYRAQWF